MEICSKSICQKNSLKCLSDLFVFVVVVVIVVVLTIASVIIEEQNSQRKFAGDNCMPAN